MMKEKITKLFKMYGTEENDKMLRKNYGLAILMLIIIAIFVNYFLPEMRSYFWLLEFAMAINLICMYFLRKKIMRIDLSGSK